jgi:hypothetical protein
VSRGYDVYKYLLFAFADFWYMNFCFAIYCGAAGVISFGDGLLVWRKLLGSCERDIMRLNNCGCELVI